MKTLIVVAHPSLASSNTQAFLKAGAALSPQTTWHPVAAAPEVSSERQLVQSADRIIFQFPLIWYTAPAELTMWLSSVWTMSFGDQLAGKDLGVVVTLGRTSRDYHPGGAVGVSLDDLLSPYVALANTANMRWLAPMVVDQFARQSEVARRRLLIAYQQYLDLPKQSFGAEAEWWQKALAKRPEAALIKSALAERQDQLAGLQQALKEVRDD